MTDADWIWVEAFAALFLGAMVPIVAAIIERLL